MSVTDPGAAADGRASTSLFATWRLLRASSDLFADHTAATFELLVLEWQEERARVLRLLFLTLVATVFVLLLIAFSGLFLLAMVWETPLRIPVAGALLVTFAAGAWLAWRRTGEINLSGSQPFAALREELAKDRALFRTQTQESDR